MWASTLLCLRPSPPPPLPPPPQAEDVGVYQYLSVLKTAPPSLPLPPSPGGGCGRVPIPLGGGQAEGARAAREKRREGPSCLPCSTRSPLFLLWPVLPTMLSPVSSYSLRAWLALSPFHCSNCLAYMRLDGCSGVVPRFDDEPKFGAITSKSFFSPPPPLPLCSAARRRK